MKLKRYLAPNMREVMNLVREELGEEAVIMSTRQTPEGIEVMAAVDPDANAPVATNSSASRASYQSPEMHDMQHAAGSAEIRKMSDELKAMKQMLENQLSGLAWQQSEMQDPAKVALIKKLVQLGIGWELSQRLVEHSNSHPDQAWSDILYSIEKLVPVDDKDIVDTGGIVALVGPTGVGKTTTIAKMASRFVMRNHPSQIALVTTDCYKIGAQAQLKTFADLLGVPVHVVGSEGELYSLLGSLAGKKLVLIDTAGMSQRDMQLSQQLTKQKAGIATVRNFLVMSAATQLNVMKEIVDSFGQIGLNGCILTKVDEATQLGNILTVLIEQKLSLAYLSNGQRVPEDLEPIRVRELIDRAIVLGQQNNTGVEAEMAFRLGMGKEITDAQ